MLAEIGWQLPPQIAKLLNEPEAAAAASDKGSTCESITSTSQPPASSSSNSQLGSSAGDVKSIPLAGAFVRRVQMSKCVVGADNVRPPSAKTDSDYDLSSPGEYSCQEVIVLQSPDLSRSCVLAFENEVQFSSWLNALQKVVAGLNRRLVARLNEVKRKERPIESKIVFINWFLEQQVAKMVGGDVLGEVSSILSLNFDHH